jgi:hypothetical protein
MTLLRRLALEPPGALRGAAPGMMPMGNTENIMRGLAILAQLRDGGSETRSNPTGGGAIPDPMASKVLPDLLKLRGLFGDIDLSPARPRL